MRIREFFRNEFFKNHIIQWLFSFGLLGNGIMWGLCIWYFHDVHQVVTMRFNAYLGIDPFAGFWWEPYQIPLMASLFSGIALLLAWNFFQGKDRIMAHLVMLCSVVMQIFAGIALAGIIGVNR